MFEPYNPEAEKVVGPGEGGTRDLYNHRCVSLRGGTAVPRLRPRIPVTLLHNVADPEQPRVIASAVIRCGRCLGRTHVVLAQHWTLRPAFHRKGHLGLLRTKCTKVFGVAWMLLSRKMADTQIHISGAGG